MVPSEHRRHDPVRRKATFRFYEELNDFLPDRWKKTSFEFGFSGRPSIKDTIEAIGIPHTEIDLILVNGRSVDFGYQLMGDERVAVYPVFERFDISPVTRLRARPLRNVRFVLDVHLGKLARYLRMLGFDTVYQTEYDDETIIEISQRERRCILTRDLGLLKHGSVTHGYWLRETDPFGQLREVVKAFDLKDRFSPFTRCMTCNGEIVPVEKDRIVTRVSDRIYASYDTFTVCRNCDKVFWAGSHYEHMKTLIERVRSDL